MSALADALRARSDADLAYLLKARPDLASPAPSSVVAMATRAGTRPSVDRALAGLTRFELQVAEAIVALAADAPAGRAVGLAELEAGLGIDPGAVVGRLRDLGLLVAPADAAEPRDAVIPVPALTGVFGPYPAGLGPRLATMKALHPGEPAPSSAPVTPDALAAVLAGAPQGARRVLDALTWGPPIGTVDAADAGPGPGWLLANGVLRRLSPTQLVLPREVALAARGGRLIRDVEPVPVLAEAPVRATEPVGAESALAASEVVRRVAVVLATWDDASPTLLRGGGLAVRELRRIATALETETCEAAFAVEVAAMAGLIGPWSGDDGPTWVGTADADLWLETDLAERWAVLARAWAGSTRASWLVGTRDERDALRPALGPGLDRSWAPGLRRRVLGALGAWPVGAAPAAGDVYRALAWWAPRATPRPETVEAVLREMRWLGLLGAGALSGAGRALLGEAGAEEPAPPAFAEKGCDALVAALEVDLPPAVDDLVVQADLTGLVAGRPSRALAALLDAATEVESRGAALTVRFTAESIRRALDGGMDGEGLLAGLRAHSRVPLPQPLEYLVADVARRHASLRVGAASSYVRSDDSVALAALATDVRLASLRLRVIAPTVLVSAQPAAVVREVLRSEGVGSVVEGPDGEVVSLAPSPRRAVTARGKSDIAGRADSAGRADLAGRADGAGRGGMAGRAPLAMTDHELARIVASMRQGDDLAAAAGLTPGAGAAPAHALAVLRDAADTGETVGLVVAGPTGSAERRQVKVLSMDGGRVRVVDVAREAELTIAVHRIIDATAAEVTERA